MLTSQTRAEAVRLLGCTGLADAILPELTTGEPIEPVLAVINRLEGPGFPLALAAVLYGLVDTADARQVCNRWRLSNKETDRVGWLIGHFDALDDARSMRWSALQPIVVAEGIEDLLALREAALPGCPEAAYCRTLLERPPEELDPPPLLTGDDLHEIGVPQGPKYRLLLKHVRDAQLDEEIHSRNEALELVDLLMMESR